MKLKDVIDIDGNLYRIIQVGDNGFFEAEPIGKVVAKGFTRPQNDLEMVEELNAFCDRQNECCGCFLAEQLDCCFEDYNSKQLDEAYRIIKECE